VTIVECGRFSGCWNRSGRVLVSCDDQCKYEYRLLASPSSAASTENTYCVSHYLHNTKVPVLILRTKPCGARLSALRLAPSKYHVPVPVARTSLATPPACHVFTHFLAVPGTSTDPLYQARRLRPPALLTHAKARVPRTTPYRTGRA
jgi:hypothetical protein